MNRTLVGGLAAGVVFVVVDLLWLGVVARSTYQQAIGHLMADKPNLVAAVVFYIVYTVGLTVFVLVPQADDPGWGRTLLMGAFFGFVAYATYDLSNLATLKGWPVRLAVIDMVWGALLSTLAVGAGKAAMNLGGQALT